jgi:GxxExxY protein
MLPLGCTSTLAIHNFWKFLLTDEHRAQVLNYLKATGYRLGLLVNFGHYPKLEYERIIL